MKEMTCGWKISEGGDRAQVRDQRERRVKMKWWWWARGEEGVGQADQKTSPIQITCVNRMISEVLYRIFLYRDRVKNREGRPG